MRWIGDRQSSNVEDRRDAGGSGLGGTGPISGFRFPGGRLGGGGLGIGGVVVVLIIGWIAGVNPLDLLNGPGGGISTIGGQSSSPVTGKVGTPTDQGEQFVATVLADTEDAWTEIFSASGKQYESRSGKLLSRMNRM